MRIAALCLLLMPWVVQAEEWKVAGDEQFAPYSFVTIEDDLAAWAGRRAGGSGDAGGQTPLQPASLSVGTRQAHA